MHLLMPKLPVKANTNTNVVVGGAATGVATIVAVVAVVASAKESLACAASQPFND